MQCLAVCHASLGFYLYLPRGVGDEQQVLEPKYNYLLSVHRRCALALLMVQHFSKAFLEYLKFVPKLFFLELGWKRFFQV